MRRIIAWLYVFGIIGATVWVLYRYELTENPMVAGLAGIVAVVFCTIMIVVVVQICAEVFNGLVWLWRVLFRPDGYPGNGAR